MQTPHQISCSAFNEYPTCAAMENDERAEHPRGRDDTICEPGNHRPKHQVHRVHATGLNAVRRGAASVPNQTTINIELRGFTSVVYADSATFVRNDGTG